MCFPDRCTERRSRSPAFSRMARRTRALRRSALSSRGFIVPSSSLLLAFLAEDVFVRIFDALALVGLRRPKVANFRGDLADPLLVDAADDDLGRPRRGDRDPLGDRIADIVAVAEREL